MTKCFGFRLTKTRKILILVLGLVALIGLGVVPYSQLSVYGYAKSVPIQLGYNEAQEYWILSSVVSEKERFKMVLHAKDTKAIDGETQAKAESEVGLLFDPLLPISETNLDVTDYKYKSKLPHWSLTWEYTKAPLYDINDAGWLTTARYDVSVYKDGAKVTGQQVNINYKEPRITKLDVDGNDVTITNLGILPQGVEVPSGDLMVMRDPNLHEHVVAKADVVQMLQRWDEYSGGTWYVRGTTLTWSNLWTWARNNGYLPPDIKLVHISDVTYQGDMDYVRLYYADIVFAGDITVYIPAELADTVIVNLYQPKPSFVNIDPSPLPAIYEGDDVTLSVTIKNVGTEGTISVTIQSERYAANPITETFADFDEGQMLTFRWKVYALNVESDTSTELTITAQGRGGTITEIVEGSILDKPSYTPPDPPTPPDPVPPSPTVAIPWELLIVVGVGIVIIWYVWRRKK